MARNEVEKRQRAKSSEAQIQRILEQDYALAPRVAQAVLEEVQDYLKTDDVSQESGQIVVNLVRHDSGHGQALSETETVCVHWTVDAGKADKEVGRKEGLVALRRHRIVRLLD